MKRMIYIVLCLSALMTIAGCGVSKRALNDAERRIASLIERGVPDSSLSVAKVLLYQAKDCMVRGNHGLARESADSMNVLLAQAEEKYASDMERLKPFLAEIRSKFQTTRAQLTGMHLARFDSLNKIVDSLVTLNWLIAAEAEANKIDSLLPRIVFDQQRANELRDRITGVWICANNITHETDKSVKGVEKKVFTFNKDGSVLLVENKQGKTGPFLKEDWEFKSWGTWDLYGDTAYLYINRFAAVKQNFEEYHKSEDGKEYWEKKTHPTYDSTITDGSQNRWISFADLTADFKKQ